jgi:8-amino-3,8-dideoxy-alpha-D-manno-octulosonate transaminase
VGINSFQFNKTITSGEGGAVVTSDPAIFERALRFHDVGVIRSPYTQALNGGVLSSFASPNFRMSEFTGAVLRGQLRKLETICTGLRTGFRTVREALAGLPGLRFRKSPDLDGDLGVAVFLDLGTHERRNRFLKAMSAENVPAAPPGGSAILPIQRRIETKATLHPGWPSFLSPRGRAIEYGRNCCPRTIDILGRFAGVTMDPTFTPEDLRDIARAIRKVYLALGRGS